MNFEPLISNERNFNVEAFQMTFSHGLGIEYYRIQANGWGLILEAGNILGYFDYIGPIVGIARIIFAVTQLNTKPDVAARIPFVARGLAEISPWRICLVPIDLFNSYFFLPKYNIHSPLTELVIEKPKTE